MKQPDLYALMIAIDDYPTKSHRLNGCKNDQNGIKEYFENRFPAHHRHIKTLYDAEATRQNIIDGFQHFQQVKAGDICLFAYSGHGSQSAAPPEFQHLESKGLNESIVCYDSRIEGGKDLMDKELGWLLWKASQKKGVHFVVMMDCCHSGSNTRNTNFKVRTASTSKQITAAKNYLGFKDYIKTTSEKGIAYSVPRGNYIHLTAAKNNELAKELLVEGKNRGVFTFSLLETLEQSNGQLSYSQLINQVRLRVFNRVTKQSPQVEGADQHQLFLGGAIQPIDLQVGFNHIKKHWQLNAGQIHGIVESTSSEPALIYLENEKQVRITRVLPTTSKIEEIDSANKSQTFNARILRMPLPKLKLAFTSNSTDAQKEILRSYLKKEKIEIVDDIANANYQIHADEKGFKLLKHGEQLPIFRSIIGTTKNHAIDFWNKTEKVAKWVRYLELTNPASRIKETDVEVEIFRTTEAGNINDNAPVEKVKNLSESIPFEYLSDETKYHSPAFQTKLTNRSKRPLWISALFFSKDCGITNMLLPKYELMPHSSVWLRQLYEGVEYKTIPLELNDIYFKQGIHEIFETLKLLISSEEFDTEEMCQDGLAIEGTRKIGGKKKPFAPDWTTKEISFQIIRKKE